MKKIISIVILLITALTTIGQNNYPLMGLDSNQTPIVILSLNQAQKADSLLNVLSVYKMYPEVIKLSNIESNIFNNSDSICDNIIKEKDNIIKEKDGIISKKDTTIKEKDTQISNLKEQVSTIKTDSKLCDEQKVNQEGIIKEKDKIIKTWKLKTAGSWLVTILLTTYFISRN